MITIALRRFKKYDMLVDGDDALVIVESEDMLLACASLESIFTECGHKFVFEPVRRDQVPEEIFWCQCRPVLTVEGYKFVRAPGRIITRLCVGTKLRNACTRSDMLWSRAMCEFVLNRGTPIIQEFAFRIVTLLKRKKGKMVFDATEHRYGLMQQELQSRGLCVDSVLPLKISDEARHSYFLAFGVPVEVQIEYEYLLSNWTPNLDEALVLEPPDMILGSYDWYQPEYLASGSLELQ